MITRKKKTDLSKRCIELTIAMTLISLIAACAAKPTVQQQDLETWAGVSVKALDTHAFFMTVPMFRTKTPSGTEIRNYAFGYDFQECFNKAGASKIGDFVGEDTFITCSSSRIVCNNLFYIKEGTVLEYAPTGRCDTDEKIQPNTRNAKIKIPKI